MKGGGALDDFVLGTYYLGFYYTVLFYFCEKGGKSCWPRERRSCNAKEESWVRGEEKFFFFDL